MSSRGGGTLATVALFAAAASSLVWTVLHRNISRRGVLHLEDLAKRLSKQPTFAARLVAHRGFHYPLDDLRRPLENTLAAYERAWAAGIAHCECDVSLTKDGEIVLCHDQNLKRLALRPAEETAVKDIASCNFAKELEFFPLKDGSRVPTLKEVLSAAKRVGNGSKLVIEIKGEDAPCATAVGKLVDTSDLGDYIAVVMGFSLTSVKTFAALNTGRGKGQVYSMLLTVRRRNDKNNQYFDLDQADEVLKVIRANNIDGLYLQYDAEYLDDDRFINLCKQIPVGVWGRFLLDPDNEATAQRLLARGAKFVNSDFPDNFFG
jgi:glycerophosphoryl diester phosphodiesterase